MVFLMVVVLASCEEQLPNENFNNIPSKATQSQQSSYLGKWEAVSMESEPPSITITEDKVYFRSKTESGNFTTSGPFSYVISSDNHYVYLDIINPFESTSFDIVLIWIEENTMVVCSKNLKEIIPSIWDGTNYTQSYNEHIGTTPTGTQFYGGSCKILVRPNTAQNTIPTNADLEFIAEWANVAINELKSLPCKYYQSCSILLILDSTNLDTSRSYCCYIMNNGEIIGVEDVGIKYLNGYQFDDRFTDSNLVITDNR